MTNKTKTILLIVVALGVWGYAGMEWFSYLNNEDSSTSGVVEVNNVSVINYLVESEPYSPQYDYQDPFIKKNGVKPVTSKPAQDNQKTHSEKPINNAFIKKEDNSSEASINLVYRGTISNDEKTIGLIEISESAYAVRVGDVVNGIHILEITPDYIFLESGSEKIKVIK